MDRNPSSVSQFVDAQSPLWFLKAEELGQKLGRESTRIGRLRGNRVNAEAWLVNFAYSILGPSSTGVSNRLMA